MSAYAYVLYPDLKEKNELRSAEARLEEAVGLARAIDLTIIGAEVVPVREIKPSTYIGRGVIDRLAPIFKEKEVDVVIMDCALTPVQQRNLEKAWQTKVIDRTALILEIFGERARTKEGVLQVELAHLTYQRSRLVRSWTHLERQRGGAGFLGGPGETQIEIDRRIIDDKIVRIKKELEQVKKTRSLQRRARQKVPYPVVALVGYTNAGKSTLFNKLTKADVFAKDLLFATLDPTLREIRLPSGRRVILSDTVGFISDLPHELVAAFRATLEEVVEADIILHVRDCSHPDTYAQKQDVEAVLKDLGLKEEVDAGLKEVLNKIDLLDDAERQALFQKAKEKDRMWPVSALTGEGLDLLLAHIDETMNATQRVFRVRFPVEKGEILAKLYERGSVLNRKDTDTYIEIDVVMPEGAFGQLMENTPDLVFLQ